MCLRCGIVAVFLPNITEDRFQIIGKHSRRRTQVVPYTSAMEAGTYTAYPVEVSVGGSTVFVLNIERFEKV